MNMTMADKKRKATAPAPPFLRVITGDELGLIRVVDVPAGPNWSGSQVVSRWGQPDKKNAVVTMTISSTGPSGEAVLAIARPNGEVDIMSTLDGTVVATLPAVAKGKDAEAAVVRAMQFLQPSQEAVGPSSREAPPTHKLPGGLRSSNSSWTGQLVTCTASGVIRCHTPDPSTSSTGAAAAAGGAAPCSIPSHWLQTSSFQTCSNATCMAMDSSGSYIAVGGDGCLVQVWDLQRQQQVFKAKGGKPNSVGLVDLPHITALSFLPASGTTATGGTEPPATGSAQQPATKSVNGAASSAEEAQEPPALQLLAGTVKHKLWLYDLAVGKRPQMELAWGEAKITALASEPSGKHVWVANGLGNVEALDVANKKVGGSLKGAGGSLRMLQRHPELPLLASVGLDRFLRVHDTNSRKCLCKVYLKQQLTGVVFAPVPPVAAAEPGQLPQEEAPEADEAEAEEAFATMEPLAKKHRGTGSSQMDKQKKSSKGKTGSSGSVVKQQGSKKQSGSKKKVAN